MTPDARSLEAAHAAIRELIAAKLKYLVPMTITFMVSYIGLTVTVRATSREQLDNLYRALSSHPMVKMVL